MSLTRLIGVSLLLVAAPLLAAVRQHAVTTLPTVTISGVVRDAGGNPVPGAIVSSGTSFSNRNGTATDGKYSLTLPANRPLVITVEDFAYETRAFAYTPTSGGTLDLTLLTRRPAVTVKLTSGETHELDLGSSQFAYFFAFIGYTRFDNATRDHPAGPRLTIA